MSTQGQIHSFRGSTAPEAVEKTRAALGPDAVVLQVRRIPAQGLQRLWRKPQIEIQACLPEKEPSFEEKIFSELQALKTEVSTLRRQSAEWRQASAAPARFLQDDCPWRTAVLMEQAGFFPVAVEQVLQQMIQLHGPVPPPTAAEEMELLRAALDALWPEAEQSKESAPHHVFIGPAGSGKSTAICKWMAQEVLLGGRACRVWQLHLDRPNTGDQLALHCEILGVPLERHWDAGTRTESETGFVDLPGTDPGKPGEREALASTLHQFPGARVHLVLNGAYETSLLLKQAKAFAACGFHDLILTHLDEEKRWGKFWNLVLGTNCSLRFLSAGQNVPGEFRPASPRLLFQPRIG